MPRAILAAAVAFLLSLHCAAEAATGRVALVIGIGKYDSLSALGNPVPDARAIAAGLRKHGFDVSEHYDLTRADFLDVLESFKSKAEGASTALIYYAGHGLEIEGKNILAPRDLEIECDPKKAKRAVELQKIFDSVASVPQQIVLLDACRNDPFPQCPTRSAQAGGGFRGLTRLGTEDSSVLIANATLSGALAADGKPGEHSPFARALLARFEQNPRTYIRDLLDMTAQDVRRATGGTQIPEIVARGGSPRICLEGVNCGDGGGSAPTILSDKGTLQEVRDTLSRLGYVQGSRGDGAEAELEAAIRRFQSRSGLTPDGQVTPTLMAVLRAMRSQIASLPPGTAATPQTYTAASGPPGVQGELEHDVGSTFRDCEQCPEMVVVPAGRFVMGAAPGEPGAQKAEGPTHEVKIGRPFAVSKLEVTFDNWEACAIEGGCGGIKPKDGGWGKGRRPVINVSWDDAKAYVTWLRERTGKSYRLLSEAEWEYAARGGTTTAYAMGGSITTDQANYDGSNTGTRRTGTYRGQTVESGSFQPNPFGLHDMHGNVAEWVEDCWNPTHAGAPSDGTARGGDCKRRVLKGGGWYYEAAYSRSAARISYPAGSRLNVAGFRIARTLE
ncbi:MAG: SUMF1/EgtB/PvdO family nonheme iron enzyme [Pseudomonadota bacterium]|nr:SUMF1/EgtB/PvdO family nonheme iron enzyme [Pseudomonadota bacterium]